MRTIFVRKILRLHADKNRRGNVKTFPIMYALVRSSGAKANGRASVFVEGCLGVASEIKKCLNFTDP